LDNEISRITYESDEELDDDKLLNLNDINKITIDNVDNIFDKNLVTDEFFDDESDKLTKIDVILED
jgi:hypothetical protein